MRGLSCPATACAFSKRAAGLEIGGDPGRAEHVAAELDLEAGFGRAPSDHAVGVNPVHRLVG